MDALESAMGIVKSLVIAVLVVVLLAITVEKLNPDVVSVEQTEVEATVVDTYHRSAYSTPVKSGQVTTFVHHSEINRIIVEHNGSEYNINDETTYETYKDCVGKTVFATLEKRTYEDGSVGYGITEILSVVE